MQRRRPRARPGKAVGAGAAAEGGFTLMELIVAVGISAILLALLGPSLAAALKMARISRDYEVGAALGSQQVEELRALAWGDLAMPSVDTAAPLLTADGDYLDGTAAGLPDNEPLVIATGGAVTPRVEETIGGVDYVAWRYVSLASDGVRRVTIVVEWEGPGADDQYRASVLISDLTAGGFGVTTTIPAATTTSTAATTTTSATSTTFPTTTTTTSRTE